jgi:penicillin amidase
VLGIAAWLFVLPLPKTSGTIHLAGLKAAVDVERDAMGIPHIHAQSLEDLYLAQGYVTAQDRLWQLDLLRRVAKGEVAEIAGPRALALDIDSRILGIRLAAEAAVPKLPPDQGTAIAAYTRGVNEFINTHSTSLPVEYKLLNVKPQPWTEADSLAIGLHMFRNLTTTWKDELLKSALLQRVGPTRTADLLPTTTKRDRPPALQMTPPDRAAVLAEGLPLTGEDDAVPGSNNWVVAGWRSASGKAMLANDPHLEFALPSIWYVAQLSAGEMNVAGVTLPGLPGVVIGHNDKIAWGLTNFGADVQDLYLESVDPDNPRRYLVDGEWKDAEIRKEVIHIKGQRDHELEVTVTRHGPLIVNKPGERYALRWVATEPGVWNFPFISIDAATNWEQFTAALRKFPGPTQNFVYADAAGNIGYYGAGLVPIRPKGDGNLPLRGDLTENDWKGYIPFEQLPHVYNPPAGVIATANAKVVPEDYPYVVATRWETPDRTERIYQLLAAKSKLTPDDFRRIQFDSYSGPHFRIAQAVARAVATELKDKPGMNPRLVKAAETLRTWDGVSTVDTNATTLAELTREEFRQKLLLPVLGDIYPRYDWRMAEVFLERVIAERPANWLPQGYADYDQLLTDSLASAMVEAEKRFKTPKMEEWRWGKVMETTFANPIGGSIPGLRRIFNLGPFEQPGTAYTVKQTTHTLGPSMRLVVDFGDLEKTTLTTTTGESGHPLSSHYRDQFPKWKAGEGVPLSFAVSAPGRDKLTLEP